MAAEVFKVTTDLTGSKAAVQCSGELDMSSADEFRKAVLDSLAHRPLLLELDFTDLDFMDSAGIGALTEAYRAAQGKKVMVQVAVTGQPLKVLQIAGLTEALGISVQADAV